MATDYPVGSDNEHGLQPRRRRDGPDGLDQNMGSGPVAADMNTPNVQRRIDSKTLLGGERTIVIQHQGEEYTLRLTRLGKLLLTK